LTLEKIDEVESGLYIYLMESGILLSRMASKVYVIYKGGGLGGDKEMIDLIKKKENVELVPPLRSSRSLGKTLCSK